MLNHSKFINLYMYVYSLFFSYEYLNKTQNYMDFQTGQDSFMCSRNLLVNRKSSYVWGRAIEDVILVRLHGSV